MMIAHDVIEIVGWLEASDIAVWLDGGWGIDALVGVQTRLHDDLDVVIPLGDVPHAQAVLAMHSFVLVEDELPTRFVLHDPNDRRIDFHPVTFDVTGSGIQQLQSGASFCYPAQGFTGRGLVDGRIIRCLSPEVQMLCHTGYPPDANDHHDVRLLHSCFGLPLPTAYT